MAKNSDIIKIGFDYKSSLEQFAKETNGVFDGISEKAGKQKISIQLDAKNDKVIEKIKELQKLKLDKFTFEFGESGLAEQLKTFDQLEKKITEIINLSKGLGTTSSHVIDVSDSATQIDKLQSKLDELSKKYDELSSKKINSSISGKDIDLVDNEEFKRLSDEFSILKDELIGLKREMQLFEEATVSADTFVSMEHSVNGLIIKVDNLIDKYTQLSVAQKNINPVKSNISSGNEIVEGQNKIQEEFDETRLYAEEAQESVKRFYRSVSNAQDLFTEEGHAWFSSSLEGAKTYSNGKNVFSGDINPNDFYTIDANGANRNSITWLGDGVDEVSKRMIYLKDRIEEIGYALKDIETNHSTDGWIDSEYEETAKSLKSELRSVKREYAELDASTENMYGTHDTRWFEKQAEALGYLGVQIKNVVDLGDEKTRSPEDIFLTDVVSVFSPELVSNIQKITESGNEVIESQNKVQAELKETAEQAEQTAKAVQEASSTPIKDVFQEGTESSEMDKVATATEEAVQAKKDFATANEGVQDSVDGSKSKLELETELMERLAKSAREAADAKKEFVEANKEVKDSVDDTGKSAKKDKYKDKAKISEDDYIQRTDYFSSIANQKLTDSGNTILGNNVSTELVDGLVKVNAKIKDADGSWKTFSAKIDADGNMFEQRFRTITKNVDKLESELEDFGRETSPALTYQETLDKANDIRRSLNLGEDFQIKVDSNELVTITKKISDVDSATTSVTQTFRSVEDAIQNFGKAASNSAEKTSVALKGVKQSADASVDAVKEEKISLSSMQTEIDRYNKNYKNLNRKPTDANRSTKYQSALDDYKKSIDELQNFYNTLDSSTPITSEQLSKWKELTTNVDTASDALKAFSAAEKGSTEGGRWKEIDKISKYLDNNTRISKEAKQRLQGYLALLKSGAPVNIEEIHMKFNQIAEAERIAGKEGKRFLDTIKDKAWYGWAAQLAGMVSFYDIINIGRQGFEVIKEYDNALTEMNKVSNESIETLKEFQKASFDLADSVGTTASQIQNSTADFLRLGESFEQAKQSAQDANALFKVSEYESINEATDALISMSQAYKELEKSEINDVLNYVGNNFSLSTSDLATAMKDAAAVLTTQGNDLYEAVALITAGNAITQDPTKTAGGVRTISLRIAGTEEAKEQLQDLGESVDDYVVQTKSKTQETIKNFTAVASNMGKGIDVLDANGNLRATYDILLDISKIYKEIQEEDKKYGTNRANALVEYIAGKNRSNIASSILLNPELLEEVKKSALANAEGSVQKELEAQLESIETHLLQLKNAWDELWINENNREVINFFLDLAKGILEVVDDIGVLNTAIMGIGVFAGFKNVGVAQL